MFLELRRFHGSSIFTAARAVTQPFATASPPNKTHHEERLCLDPRCNVFHMCSPSPSLHLHPPPPTSHPHVSPIPAPSCQCHPLFFLLTTLSLLEKKKKKIKKPLDFTFTCALDRCSVVRRPCKTENYKQGEGSESQRHS